MNDHLQAENRALRSCLQALLQERDVLVHCPDNVYRPIRGGFGGWGDDLVSIPELREAGLLLKAVRESRESGDKPAPPSWRDVAPALTVEVVNLTAHKIAAWIEENPPGDGLSAGHLLADEIREGAWK